LSKKYEPSLLLTLKHSGRLKRVLISMHVLAMGACLANALPPVIKVSLLTGICLHLWVAVKRLTDTRPTIKFTEAAGWEISEGQDFEPVRILNSTVITLYAIFLHVTRQDQGKKTIIVLSDALLEDDYRRLIVKLRTTVITR
jgi:membrane-bound toxin of toxin-antitoxin system